MAEHILRTVGGFGASSPWGHKTLGSTQLRLRNNHHRGKYFSLITWGIVVSGFIAQLGAVPQRYWAILAFTKINWILPQNDVATTITQWWIFPKTRPFLLHLSRQNWGVIFFNLTWVLLNLFSSVGSLVWENEGNNWELFTRQNLRHFHIHSLLLSLR